MRQHKKGNPFFQRVVFIKSTSHVEDFFRELATVSSEDEVIFTYGYVYIQPAERLHLEFWCTFRWNEWYVIIIIFTKRAVTCYLYLKKKKEGGGGWNKTISIIYYVIDDSNALQDKT